VLLASLLESNTGLYTYKPCRSNHTPASIDRQLQQKHISDQWRDNQSHGDEGAVPRENPAAYDTKPEKGDLHRTGGCSVEHGLELVVSDGLNDKRGELCISSSANAVSNEEAQLTVDLQ
jgi:hypothetical protein